MILARRLGGPKPDDKDERGKKSVASARDATASAVTVAAPAPLTKVSRFLHDIHDSACRIFGTTLGPEANEAHRNHFHVDMAERKHSKICD
jgi:hypothetical protein